MRVWIFKLSEFTPWDIQRYGERKSRYSLLAEALVADGHSVMWWTDDFTHYAKERGHRFGKDHFEEVDSGITVRWIHSPGYERNVSFRRFADHRIVARKMLSDAENWPRPDLILGAMPTDAMSSVSIQLGERYGVPVVLDVRDQWPDIFYSQLPKIFRPAMWVFTRAMDSRVRGAFESATAVTGNTAAFVGWGLNKSGRFKTPLDRAFPIGYEKQHQTQSSTESAEVFWKGMGIERDDDELKICFLGAFSKMYDFEPLFEAAALLLGEKRRIKFILCGAGEKLESLRNRSQALSNVVLPGRVSGEQLSFLLGVSDLSLAPYIDDKNFRDNIANKPAEYLAHNLPILSSIRGLLTELLEHYDCGRVYEDGADLAMIIRSFQDDPQFLNKSKKQAGTLFNDKFDARVIYREFSQHLESIWKQSTKR